MENADSYASGHWFVTEGSIDEFLSRWREFLEWTRDNAQGFQHAFLLQNEDNPNTFVSYSTWNDHASEQQWRAMPDFAQKFGACRALCDNVEAGDYKRAISIG